MGELWSRVRVFAVGLQRPLLLVGSVRCGEVGTGLKRKYLP